MTKFIVIASGKGGVGKTTTAINLGTALTSYGKDVIVVDANIKTPNVGIYLGSTTVPVSLHDVLKGKNHITEAIYMHSHGLKVIPGSIASKDADVDHNRLSDALLDLSGVADVVIIDSGPGLSEETKAVLNCADEVIVVTNPNMASITDSLKTIRMAEKQGKKITGVILNRVNDDDLEVHHDNAQAILENEIIGKIPEDDTMRAAVYTKNPITYSHPDSPAAIGYKKLASKLLGQKYVESIEKKEDSFFDSILRRFGFK